MKQNLTKICTACEIEQSVTAFSKDKKGKDGLHSVCKGCQKQHYLGNKESFQQRYINNKKVFRLYQKQYRLEHKKSIRLYSKQHYLNNRETILLYAKQHYQTKGGKIISRRKKHKRRALLVGAKYEKFNPIEIFERDGYICQLCGYKTRPDFKNSNHPLYPNLDHIVPLSKGGAHTKLNTQCLCHQCNMEKGNTGTGDQLRMFG